MLVTLRKHTKLVFWIIIILLVPAFVFWGTSSRNADRARSANRVFGKINGAKITESEFVLEWGNEIQKLNYFIESIIRGKRYRKPYHDYWQALRDVYIARELHWEGMNPPDAYYQYSENPYSQGQTYIPIYLLQMSRYVMIPSPDLMSLRQQMQISEEEVQNYIEKSMFPSEEGGLDKAKQDEYMARYGLDQQELKKEAEDNLRVEKYVGRLRRMQELEDRTIFFNQIWERILLLKEVEKWDIRATDEEVAAYIQAMFGVPGKDLDKAYKAFLNSRKINDSDFRADIEKNICIEKLRWMIAGSGAVPRIDARELYDAENTQKKIAYARILSDEVKSAMEISPEGMDYYHKHRDELKNSKSANVDYLFLKNDSFISLAKISEDEARKEYDANPDKYKKEDGQRKDFIEVQSEIEKELTAKKARILSEEKAKLVFKITSASEMRNIAEQNGMELLHSDRLSKDSSNIKGFENKDSFINAALATEVGKVSEIIDVGNGYAVLSPTEVRPETPSMPISASEKIAKSLASAKLARFIETTKVILPEMAQAKYIVLPMNYFEDKVTVTEEEVKNKYEADLAFATQQGRKIGSYEEVKTTLEKQLKQTKSVGMARASLDCKTLEEFEQLPAKFTPPLIIRTTDFVIRSQEIDKFMLNSPMFSGTMFSLPIGSVSKPLPLEQGYVVITPIKKRPEIVKTLKEILDIAKKEKPAEEEQKMLEEAGFGGQTHDQLMASLLTAFDEGAASVQKEELQMVYDASLEYKQPPEEIKIPHERKVSYICVEKENVKDYLNKPFDFEIRNYYDANRGDFTDNTTGKSKLLADAKAEIEKILSEKRIQTREERTKKYYEQHKDEFKKTVDGKEITPTLDEVREEIAEKVQNEELDGLAMMRAQEMKLLMRMATQLEFQARKQGLILHESNFFSLDNKSKIDAFLTGEEELFRNVAFVVPLGEVVDLPIRTEKGYCILSPFAERPYEKDKVKDFADSIPALQKAWKSYMSFNAASDIARYINSEIAKKIDDEKMDFAKAAETVGFKYTETEYFKLTDKTLADFKDEKGMIPTIFAQLEQRDASTNRPLDILPFPLKDRSLFVYREIDEKKPSDSDFTANAKEISMRLMPMADAKAFEEWLRVVAKQANIEPTQEIEIEKTRKAEAEKQKSATETP